MEYYLQVLTTDTRMHFLYAVSPPHSTDKKINYISSQQYLVFQCFHNYGNNFMDLAYVTIVQTLEAVQIHYYDNM